MEWIIGLVVVVLIAVAVYVLSGGFNDDIREAGGNAVAVEGETDCDLATRALALARTNADFTAENGAGLQALVDQFC